MNFKYSKIFCWLNIQCWSRCQTPTSSPNHAIAWLAMYVWWDGSSDTKVRLTMTAHEEHGFPDPTFESIFCGSSFDPSLKADATPTFLCKFLLGVFRGWERWKPEQSPASFGTVWPSSLPICLSVSQVPYKMPALRPATRDRTVWDHGIFQNSWPQSGTHKVEPASDGLCTRLVLEALVWVLGQLLRHQSPFWLTADVQCKPNYGNTFFFFQKRAIKAQKPAKIDFFFT